MSRLIDVDAMIKKMTKELKSEKFDKGTVAMANCFIKILNEQPTANIDKDVREDAYNKGLNDAWKLARKIFTFNNNKMEEIFGVAGKRSAFDDLSPQVALAKLEIYEKEQNEIKVGDVVRANNYPNYEFVVCYIHISEIGGYATYGGITEKGTWFANDDVKKTGKHIDLTDIFKQIGSDADELS